MKKNLVVAENSENYRSGVTEAAVHALELVCTSLGEDVAEQISRAFISRIAEARALREVIAWAHSREEAFIGRHQADLRTDRICVQAPFPRVQPRWPTGCCGFSCRYAYALGLENRSPGRGA